MPLPISSISGGTDVVSAFAGGSTGVPVVAGELSVRYLGVALDSWAPDRTPLVGEVGEMVITAPMPSPLRLLQRSSPPFGLMPETAC